MGKEHIDTPQDALSALADGQLRGEAFALAVERVAQQPEAQATWHAYHVVSDVLRSNDLAFCADDQGFLARFQDRLALEPVFSPNVNTTNLIAIAAYKSSANALLDAQDRSDDMPANAPRFHWKMVVGVASLLAVWKPRRPASNWRRCHLPYRRYKPWRWPMPPAKPRRRCCAMRAWMRSWRRTSSLVALRPCRCPQALSAARHSRCLPAEGAGHPHHANENPPRTAAGCTMGSAIFVIAFSGPCRTAIDRRVSRRRSRAHRQ